MIDTRIATAGMWGLSADGLQWILLRGRDRDGGWRPMSFVRSTRDILARCMREKGVPSQDAARLLAGLPAIFSEWAESRESRAFRNSHSISNSSALSPKTKAA